jgi:hypothetical protein
MKYKNGQRNGTKYKLIKKETYKANAIIEALGLKIQLSGSSGCFYVCQAWH